MAARSQDALGRFAEFSNYRLEHCASAGVAGESPGSESPDDVAAALEVLSRWPGYHPTPLLTLVPLAARLGLRRIYYKDESRRFGLGSFKAMGGAYATGREIARVLGLPQLVSFEEICAAVRESKRQVVVACATDGNHGRAVAWAASRLGVQCVVFVHEAVSAARVRAITELGATVRRTPGNYDDSVRAAAAHAATHGWRIVSDTAYDGYEQVPTDIMRGYSALAEETYRQLPADPLPTHIIVQAGVGGFAAAFFDGMCAHLSAPGPVMVCVEPLAAASLLASARAGRRTVVGGALDTIMAGLACGEPSTLAWSRLRHGRRVFLAIADEACAATMRVLADPALCGRPIVAGESGAAGLAGLLCAAARDDMRELLRLDADSVVLTVGTEGAMDPDSYAALVGTDSSRERANLSCIDNEQRHPS